MARKKNGSSTEVVKRDQWAVFNQTPDALADIIKTNLGGSDLTPFDFDTIKIPAGGGTVWMVPTPDSEEEPVKELEGIIIHQSDPRAYWRSSLEDSGGGSPPDCSSDNSNTGFGKRNDEEEEGSHDCGTCSLSKFGSDGKRGQACKQMKNIFMLRKDTILPIVLQLPPTSLGAAKKYLIRLCAYSIPAEGVITSWKLEKAQNQDGIGYSKAVPSSNGRLDEKEYAAVKAYAANLRQFLTANAPAAFSVESE